MVTITLSHAYYSLLIRGINDYSGLLLSLYDEPYVKSVLGVKYCKGLSLYLEALDALLDTLREASEGQE